MLRWLYIACYFLLVGWGSGLHHLDQCYVTLPEDDRPMLVMTRIESDALMKYHGTDALKHTRFQVFISKKGKWIAVNPRPERMAKR